MTLIPHLDTDKEALYKSFLHKLIQEATIPASTTFDHVDTGGRLNTGVLLYDRADKDRPLVSSSQRTSIGNDMFMPWPYVFLVHTLNPFKQVSADVAPPPYCTDIIDVPRQRGPFSQVFSPLPGKPGVVV